MQKATNFAWKATTTALFGITVYTGVTVVRQVRQLREQQAARKGGEGVSGPMPEHEKVVAHSTSRPSKITFEDVEAAVAKGSSADLIAELKTRQ